jgi:hypothetical protein
METTNLTLKEASQELGLEYNYFRKPDVYTKFCTDNGIDIIRYPGRKKVLIDRKDFEFLKR